MQKVRLGDKTSISKQFVEESVLVEKVCFIIILSLNKTAW